MRAFVTVGTTRFDDLIGAIDTAEFLEALSSKCVTQLVVQIGHGTHEPRFEDAKRLGLICSYYRFKPNLQEDMSNADLIVSHAGAGSVMESLGLGKALVVVVNDALMHNHQEELAGALAARGHAVTAYPPTVAAAVREADFGARKLYAGARPEAFACVVDEEMAKRRWV
ncbi:unnamed protein product [Phaeothamnion confervicola]